jgi:hypothetical protein
VDSGLSVSAAKLLIADPVIVLPVSFKGVSGQRDKLQGSSAMAIAIEEALNKGRRVVLKHTWGRHGTKIAYSVDHKQRC